jgi:hypothetical protein
MPCRDGGPSYNNDPEIQKKLDFLTRMLCNCCQKLGQEVYADAELAAWWNAHQEDDLRRITYEQKRAKEIQARQEALNKLSEVEKKLLGIK